MSSMIVEIVENNGEEVFFYQGHEIQKPKRLAHKVGEYVAFSPADPNGRPRFFRLEQVVNIKNMEIQY